MRKPILLQLADGERLVVLSNIDYFQKTESGVDMYVSGCEFPVATLSSEEYDALLQNFEVINLFDETHPEQASFNFKERGQGGYEDYHEDFFPPKKKEE